MTILVRGNATFGSGQVAAFVDRYAFVLDGYVNRPDPTLVNAGEVHVTSDIDYYHIAGVNNGGESFYNNSLFRNAASGILTVDAYGTGQSAFGFRALSHCANVVNEGVIRVGAADGTALGVWVSDSSFYLVNSGRLEVTGRDAVGVDLYNGGDITNSGDLIVSATRGAASAIITYAGMTLDNSGSIVATGEGPYASVAVFMPNSGGQKITNSGLIQADYAFASFEWVVDSNDGADIRLENTGTIVGVIDFGDWAHTGHYEDDVLINSGTITGLVNLGAASDIYDGTGGVQIGAVLGGRGHDVLIGTASGDQLFGGEENDTITGSGGDDYLDGGAGLDMLVLDGPRQRYAISTQADGSIRISDTTGAEGVDAVTGIEQIRFGDEVVTLKAAYRQIIGTSASERLTGGDKAEALFGIAGSDTVSGGGGNDTLVAGVGASTLNGGDGNDLIIGTGSSIDGGGGVDTLSLTGNFGDLVYTVGGATWFGKVTGIENIIGTRYHDLITGDAGANRLDGAAGDDTLDGGAGNDTLVGGEGYDTASYASATAGVTLSLGRTGKPQETGAAGTDVFVGVEGVLGSKFNDRLTGTAGDDLIGGAKGNDTLTGGRGFDFASYASNDYGVMVSLALQGTAQNTLQDGTDTLIGFEGLIGGSGDDRLTGDAGDNVLVGGYGHNMLYGGEGYDTVVFAYASSDLTISTLGERDDPNRSVTVNGHNQITTLAGVEALEFTDGIILVDELTFRTAALIGTDGADTLKGGHLSDNIHGGGGDDLLEGGLGPDFIDGGDGIDTVIMPGARAVYDINFNDGPPRVSILGPHGWDDLENVEWIQFSDVTIAAPYFDFANPIGTDGNNTLAWGGFDDVIDGLLGNDDLSGGGGNDTIDGGPGNDTLRGGAGADTASYASNEAGVTVSLAIPGPQNTLGAGFDIFFDVEDLTGTAWNDVLTGNGFDNVILGGAGDDIIRGGDGIDTASYAGAASGVTVRLGVFGDQITGGAGRDYVFEFENLTGSAWGDTLVGDGAANVLSGGGGKDTLIGAAGADTVIGRHGADSLIGGGGADVFRYASALDADSKGKEVIADLSKVDVIDLAGVDADAIQSGDQAFVLVGAFTRTAGEARLVYEAAEARTLLQMDLDGDGRSDMTITLTGDQRDFASFVL